MTSGDSLVYIPVTFWIHHDNLRISQESEFSFIIYSSPLIEYTIPPKSIAEVPLNVGFTTLSCLQPFIIPAEVKEGIIINPRYLSPSEYNSAISVTNFLEAPEIVPIDKPLCRLILVSRHGDAFIAVPTYTKFHENVYCNDDNDHSSDSIKGLSSRG